MKQFTLHLIILIAISATVFFTNLGQASLWDRDEPRNAGCAAEMMAKGDWVVPIFNDELRHQKPVLLYWLIMSAYAVFGQTEFAARFWSAVLAVGTVLATYGIARRLIGSWAGLLAGIVLSTSLMFDVAARAATPDSVLIFCGSVALWLYVIGTFMPRSEQTPVAESFKLRVPDCWFPKNYLIVVAMYVVLGFGVLAKGPVGFLLPMAIIGMFGLIQRLPKNQSQMTESPNWIDKSIQFLRSCAAPFHPTHFLRTLWAMRPITAAVVVLLVAAPWYMLVDAHTKGEFTRLFFLSEHFGRATTALESHRGGLWFYPVAILVGFFPWSMFWGPVVVTLFIRRRDAGRLSVAECFALCWIAIQVGAFSIAQTKLPSYVSPCYPALAILTANFLVIWSTQERSLSLKWMYAAYGGLILGGLIVSAGLGVSAHMFFPGQTWLLTIGLIPIIGGGLAIWQLSRGYKNHVLITTVATAFVFCLSLFGFGTGVVSSNQASQTVLKHIENARAGQVIASYRSLESSWVFYGGKTIYECETERFEPGSSLRSVESLSRQHGWEPKPRISPEAILHLHPSAMFLTTDEHYPELMQRLPDDFEIIEKADYFLRDRVIILVGRRESIADRRGQTSTGILSR